MIIKKIEIKNNIVKIYGNDDFFTISIETYLNNHILVNEEISSKEIKNLELEDKKQSSKAYLLNKLSRKKLSKNECVKILVDMGLDNIDIGEIITQFESNFLINDKELGEFIVDYYLINKKGINLIKKQITKRKIEINEDYLFNEYLDKEKYEKNISYLLEKYKKLSSNKSKKNLKSYLVNKMIENGYNIEEFIDFINLEDISDKDTLIEEINKYFKNKEVNEENIAKITKKLLSKGFNYVIIKDAIRECENNETY